MAARILAVLDDLEDIDALNDANFSVGSTSIFKCLVAYLSNILIRCCSNSTALA
jgi:hypothetical protein